MARNVESIAKFIGSLACQKRILCVLGLVCSPALFAADTPGVMRFVNSHSSDIRVFITGSEEQSKRINRRTGHNFVFTRDSDNCEDLTLNYEILAGNIGLKLASGKFAFIATREPSADSPDGWQCTMAVQKPTMNVPDYNYMLVYKKLSASKGRLTYHARPGE